jgi:hypothetical protein
MVLASRLGSMDNFSMGTDHIEWELLAMDAARAWLQVANMKPGDAASSDLTRAMGTVLRQFAKSAIGAACKDRHSVYMAYSTFSTFKEWHDTYTRPTSMIPRERERAALVNAVFRTIDDELGAGASRSE